MMLPQVPVTPKGVCQRKTLPILVSLIVLLLLPASAVQSAPNAPEAVDDYAVMLSGQRPPSGGGIDDSGYIEVPYRVVLNPSGGAMTIEAWVKRNASNRNETVVGNGWQSSYWLGFSSSGKIQFTPHGSAGFVEGNAVIPAEKWTHVAVTYDGLTRRYYVNGNLDLTTSSKSGDIKPAASGETLGIGFDRDNFFTPNYFGGLLDNVRIWNVVRTGEDIRYSMFHQATFFNTGLITEWRMNGDATDAAGNNDGVHRGKVVYTNEGAIPHDIRIPQVSGAVALDGFCTDAAYNNATKITIADKPVYLVHTTDDLWVCYKGLGTIKKVANVYLDAQYTRVDPAQTEHLRLTVDETNTTSASEGNGTNGYTATTQADGLWDAMYASNGGEFTVKSAEFRINSDLVSGWQHVIGLALDKTNGTRGSHRIWPALAASTYPSTWSSATLGGIGPIRSFKGHVVYQPPGDQATSIGIPGVEIKLIGSDNNGSEAIVSIAKSNANGSFFVTINDDYFNHRLELGSPPRGYVAESATAEWPGVVIDPRTVNFGYVTAGVYENTVFTLGDPRPQIVDSSSGPYFLIVAPEAVINAGALDEFVDFKRRIGFAIEVKSLESIDSMYSGSNMTAAVRNYEQTRLGAYGERFQYVMLVASIDDLPHAVFYEGFTGYIQNSSDDTLTKDLLACLAQVTEDNHNAKGVKIKRTDWYFADLVSGFDSNGNGCLLDGTRSESKDRAPGYTPDQRPSFSHNVSVGRIPFSNPSIVEDVLNNIVRFEQQSPAFKQQGLFALSQVFLKGQYWTPMDDDKGKYKLCPVSDDDVDDTTVSKDCQKKTTDAAYLGELLKVEFLNSLGYTSQSLYEQTKPDGASPVQSPLPLTENNVIDELNARSHGFVNIAGHGSSFGVGRTFWQDSNSNSKVDSPTKPTSGTSTSEIHGGGLLNTGMFSSITPDNEWGSVYIAASCSTLSPINVINTGTEALSQGHGVAWLGGLNMVSGGYWIEPAGANTFTVDYRVTEQLLRYHQRLGDALWQALLAISSHPDSGSADISMGLYGDPTLSYWGNPGGQTTYAAWPMLRNDARGVGYSTLSGPSTPKELWSYDVNSPGTNRSPLVSNNGEVIVAHGNYVDVLRQGQLHQRLTLDSAIYGTPALAADGTIYALDNQGKLYAYPYNSFEVFPFKLKPTRPSSAETETLGTRYRRWKTHVGTPRTSPIVGADGYIGVGTTHKITLVRPDGFVFKEKTFTGHPKLAVAMNADRSIIVTTDSGYSARIDFFCPSGECTNSLEESGKPYSTPPLSIFGAVYAGRANGEVVKLNSNADSVLATFQTDGKILAGPIAGPAGQIVVTTDNGTVYSLTKDMTLRWQRSIPGQLTGIPAFSIDALYVVSGNALRALNPYSGATLWARSLGSNVGHGSVAVGYGRQIYMETSGGKVIAYGEAWPEAVAMAKADAINPGVMKVKWFANLVTVSSSTAAEGDYLIQRRIGDGPWTDIAIVPAGITEYIDTLPYETDLPIAYRVKVIGNAGNDSDYTLTIFEPKPLPALPQSPVWDAIEAVSSDALALSWAAPTASQALLHYRVERGTNSGGPFGVVTNTSAEVTSIIDTGLQPNKQYFYRLIAINQSGESPPSAVSSQTTRKRNLPLPLAVRAETLSDSSIAIRWEIPQGLPQGSKAEVEFSQGSMSGFEGMGIVPASAKTFAYLPGEDDAYQFRIKFVNGDSESPWTYTSALVVGSGVDSGEFKLMLPSVFKR